MASVHSKINDKIKNRSLHSGNNESTYYSQELFDFAVDHYDDPLVLFKIKIYGYYQKKYKWTKEEADWFIENNKHEAYSHSDGEQEYWYDWGVGHNKITEHMMHVPHLDHIDPRSKSRDDRPQNFRIRCQRLNENKGNMTEDTERRAVVIDTINDMDEEARKSLILYLHSTYIKAD